MVFDSISSNIDDVLSINSSADVLSLETLKAIIRIGLPILVELIDLVYSVIIFLCQMTLLRWLATFLLGRHTVIVTVLLFWIYFSSDASIYSTMTFPPLRNSGHVVVLVSTDFPSYSQWDAPFHRIAYDYSRADWDGICDHLRDVPWKDTLNSVLLLLLVNFVSGFRLELMYISLIESIRSSLTYLHGFQLLVLLP